MPEINEQQTTLTSFSIEQLAEEGVELEHVYTETVETEKQ